MQSIVGIPGLAFSNSLALACLAFFGALVLSLALVPVFRRLALSSGILDEPGGRKEHAASTPLFGGLAVLFACVGSLLLVAALEDHFRGESTWELKLLDLRYIFVGSLVIFATGLIDDFFKDKLPFYFKLLGQILGSAVAMYFLFSPQLNRLFTTSVPLADHIYLLILMGWMLTVINSFNFSDNINGLSSGLAVITLLVAMVYLGGQMNTRFIILGLIMVGGILGFMPYNFPRAKIFLGDAGSMFIGYWVGIILWPLTGGFFDGSKPLLGVDHLIPPLLVLGVPLYDAAFVVYMRWYEGRPVYLGDNRHLSHRLVRCGFSKTESAMILWGIALILGGVGALSMHATYLARYMAFMISLGFMLIITVLIVKREHQTEKALEKEKAPSVALRPEGDAQSK
jgi:UDP-GlcNAc:undecaprenyl-phosphate GlcNAc-1-phosphate transferase